MFEISGDQVIQWAERRWERKSTLAIILIVLLLAFVWKFTDTSLADLSVGETIFIGGLLLTISLLWMKSTAIPKASRGRIGIGVAIDCEGDAERKKIAADFISGLRSILLQDHGGDTFQLIDIPQHHAKTITDLEIATRIRLRARCNILVFGSAKVREIQGVQKHVLFMNMQVGHRPIPRQLSQNLSREMAELFPQRLHIDTKNDLFGFEFTSEWIDCVTRYVVGIVASISGDLERSERLFLSLSANKHFQLSQTPPIKKLRQRVPIRLGEIYSYRAACEYELWRKDRQMEHIDKMWNHLTSLRNFNPGNYSGRLLTAIYYFVKERNITAAVREVRKCRDIRDATWKYSYAFLLAYSGEMMKARRIYRAAFQQYYERSDVPLQTEEFIQWVLQNEPDKIQLQFCLGLLNWKAKGDLQTAMKDFGLFIVSDASKSFPEEVRLAQAYLVNLKTELDETDNGNAPSP